MPRIVDRDARRAELLDAAFPLFVERGWAGVSMRGLARSLGVSTGTLYHYFGSQRDLFEAMFRRLIERQIQAAERALASADPAAALPAFVAGNLDELQQTLRVALDFQRNQPGESALLAELLGVYRDTLRDRFGLPPERVGPALSLALGVLVHRELDPDGVELSAHLMALGALAGADTA